jgi:hypothetical protein
VLPGRAQDGEEQPKQQTKMIAPVAKPGGKAKRTSPKVQEQYFAYGATDAIRNDR